MPRSDIAIVGMACAFPGAASLGRFWQNLVNGVDGVVEIPAERRAGRRNSELAPNHDVWLPPTRGGYLPSNLWLDPLQYGIVPNALRHGDPDQFLLLKLVDDALLDAGIAPDAEVRSRTDVIVGRGGYLGFRQVELAMRAEVMHLMVDSLSARFPEWMTPERRDAMDQHLRSVLPPSEVDSLSTSIPNIAASRTANRLNLRGAAYVVDAACASSLIAVDDAVRRLQNGESDAAVVGGVFLNNCATFLHVFQKLGALSPSGMIRPFDRRADGLVVGEGGGAIILRRIEDAVRDGNPVYAVIRGIGVSSDGRDVDVMAPSMPGQRAALERAYSKAAVDPASIGYLEAHGTATAMGDRTELATIRSFFGSATAPPWGRAIGTVKSMIGHAMPASGMAALIKTALMLSNKVIAPTLHCEQPCDEMSDLPFHVAAETRAWVHDPTRGPRRAAINSFGFGGINAHVILEEAEPRPAESRSKPALTRPAVSAVQWPTELLVFSGGTRTEVAARLRRLAIWLEHNDPAAALLDVAAAVNADLVASHPCKLALIARDFADLGALLATSLEFLNSSDPRPPSDDRLYYSEAADRPLGKVACVFPGMAFPGLSGKLSDHLMELSLHFPELREEFDRIDSRDRHPEDTIPLSVIFVPPKSLPEEFRARIHDRLALPRVGMKQPDYSQPDERRLVSQGMMFANWLCWVMIRTLEVPIDMFSGQSLGESSALCASGAIDFQAMCRVLWDTMDIDPKLAPDQKMAMASISAERLAPLMEGREGVYVAIHIAPEGLIFGGVSSSVDPIIDQLRAEGEFVLVMPFAPMHTPCMSRLRPVLEHALAETPLHFEKPKTPVYLSTTVDLCPDDREGMIDVIYRNLDHPCHLWQTLQKIYDDGARIFIHAGGGPLKGLPAKTDLVSVTLEIDTCDPLTQLNRFCATLLTAGVPLRLEPLFRHRPIRPVDLDAAKPAADRPLTAMPYRLAWGLQPVDQHEPLEPIALETSAPVPVEAGVSAVVPQQGPGNPVPDQHIPIELDHDLPFVGFIERLVPGEALDYSLRLSLEEDRFVAHHRFIEADGIKPLRRLEATFPMTFSMELIAEAASVLCPGLGLIGYENIRASKWIVFADADTLDLQIEARAVSNDPDTGVRRVEVAIRAGDGISASGTALFAAEYRQDLTEAPAVSPDDLPWPLTAREAYDTRRLFHGPLFQGVASLDGFGNPTFSATLEILPKDALFASIREPAFLADPLLLDAAGQVIGLWWIVNGEDALPIGVEKVELYGPTPPVGVRVRMTGEMTSYDSDLRRFTSRVDIDDGAGNLWIRIVGWTDVVFNKPPEISEFQKLPAETFVAREIVLPEPAPGTVCMLAHLARSRSIDSLAKLVLHVDEEAEYGAIEDPRVRRDFLVSRLAVKDAVRLWWMRRGAGPIHPATICIGHDESGRPFVSQDGEAVLPWISLAHSDGTAAAVASDEEAGIDLEPVAHRDAELNGYASDTERALLAALGSGSPDAPWDLRLWCAKEAAAKALGTGLQGRPKDFALVAGSPCGQFEIQHARTGERFSVQSFAVEEHLLALSRRGPAR